LGGRLTDRFNKSKKPKKKRPFFPRTKVEKVAAKLKKRLVERVKVLYSKVGRGNQEKGTGWQ